jgi:hypothetical protein
VGDTNHKEVAKAMTDNRDKIFRQVGFVLRDATQKEKLDVATWIVLSCLNEPQDGMTAADSYLDVVTRHCGDVLTQARGRLARYGNDGYPKR